MVSAELVAGRDYAAAGQVLRGIGVKLHVSLRDVLGLGVDDCDLLFEQCGK
jgi:hypothetical protein